ncbi:MAG: PAS domain S-box protein, partial [Candidatus Bathyarchaeia archaeon]
MFILDAAGKIVDVNQQACQSLQYTHDELLKLNITDIFDVSAKEQLPDFLGELSTDQPVVFECAQKRKDQTTFPVDAALKKVELNGEAIFVLTAKDLTERKKVELKLSTYAKLQAAIAELEQSALTQPPDLTVFLNETVKKSATVLGLDSCVFFEFSHSKKALVLRAGVGVKEDLINVLTYTVEDFSKLWDVLIRDGTFIIEDWASEKRFKMPPAMATAHVKSSIGVLVGAAGNPLGVLGGHVHGSKSRIFGDDEVSYFKSVAILIAQVIEHKNMLDKLRESEATYRDLFNGMNESAWVISFDGKFIDVNDAAVRVLGYSREELLSMGVTDIDNKLSSEQIRDLIERLPSVKQQ